eukprot:4315171-Amphidinium_carterae.1
MPHQFVRCRLCSATVPTFLMATRLVPCLVQMDAVLGEGTEGYSEGCSAELAQASTSFMPAFQTRSFVCIVYVPHRRH